MLSMSTPTRNGRGMPVPSIDTSVQDTKPIFDQSWPLTPPQSAVSNESRRPSLVYSSLSATSHSGPSSICGYSQPTTPASAMHHAHDLKQWSNYNDTLITDEMADAGSHGQMIQPMFNAGLPHQASTAYSTSDPFGATQTPWPTAQHLPMQYPTSEQAGLATTLFQKTQGLGQEILPTASMYANQTSSVTSLQASPFGDLTTVSSDSMYQPAQVVVPSQVIPHDDYPMEDYSGYHEQEDHSTQSFGSTNSGCSTWEMVGPQSPSDAYFGHSDDDEMVNVKDEAAMTPDRGQPSHTLSPRTSRPRRRTSRRGRKSHPEGKAWYESESHGIRMRCEGKRFAVVPNSSSHDQDQPFSLTVIPEETRDPKPHKCMHRDDNGVVCGHRFERSEHLKRHQGKHSQVRAYVCPVEDCNRRIGRPDNAGDHFKCHLRPHSKGRRTQPCSFVTLERGILKTYDTKTATKLLANLRKWLASEREKERVQKRPAFFARL